MKSLRITFGFILFSLISYVQAVSVEWSFTNSGLTWSNTDTITLEAILTNTDTVALELGNIATGINGSSTGWGTFPDPYNHPIGYNFNPLYDTALVLTPGFLAPGESISFTYAEFIPNGTIPTGTYSTVDTAFISGGQGSVYAYHFSTNDFTATVVPIPAAIWLFGFGLLGLLKMANRKQS